VQLTTHVNLQPGSETTVPLHDLVASYVNSAITVSNPTSKDQIYVKISIEKS